MVTSNWSDQDVVQGLGDTGHLARISQVHLGSVDEKNEDP